MNKKLKTPLAAVLVLLLGYAGSYGAMRTVRSETTAAGKRLLFPNRILAAVYLPLSALDRALTGMQSAVGNDETPDPVEP
jgi:hypothetical protein